MVKIMENPTKMDDLGGFHPPFLETLHMPHKFQLLPLLTGQERFGCPRQPNVTAGVTGGEAAECILDFRGKEDLKPRDWPGIF